MINQIIIINYDNYYRVSGDSHPADGGGLHALPPDRAD